MTFLNWSDPETVWLNITNIVLGVVVVLCAAIILGGVAHEFIARQRRRRRVDDQAFDTQSLGITMADGGEPHKP